MKIDLQDLIQLIAEILMIDAATLNSESQQEQVVGWDSMMQCQIMTEIEEKYEIEFSMEEMQETNSIGLIFNLLSERLST